jgi:hypothetical protein
VDDGRHLRKNSDGMLQPGPSLPCQARERTPELNSGWGGSIRAIRAVPLKRNRDFRGLKRGACPRFTTVLTRSGL